MMVATSLLLAQVMQLGFVLHEGLKIAIGDSPAPPDQPQGKASERLMLLTHRSCLTAAAKQHAGQWRSLR